MFTHNLNDEAESIVVQEIYLQGSQTIDEALRDLEQEKKIARAKCVRVCV